MKIEFMIACFVLCVVFLGVAIIFRKSIRSGANRLYEGLKKVDWETELSMPKSMVLFLLAVFFLALRFSWLVSEDFMLSITLRVLAIYCLYGMVLESSDKLKGFSYPNAYKILLGLIGLVAIWSICNAWVGTTWINNLSNLVDSIFNGFLRLFDYFFEHIEQIKDFLEWLRALNAPPSASPGVPMTG